ncbi:hypothetical protein ACLOJK_003175 [Asimina triloba]
MFVIWTVNLEFMPPYVLGFGGRFHYMAVSDNRQRIMPMPDDREPPRGKPLAFKEAVLLVDPINPDLKGEVDTPIQTVQNTCTRRFGREADGALVDDKYQYSSEDKDLKVHGWICIAPQVGFWVISPSDEFRTGGPLKQNLTSHVGPTSLSVFISDHYARLDLVPKFTNGEPWKKVFGPVFIYLNSGEDGADPRDLWKDAKSQVWIPHDDSNAHISLILYGFMKNYNAPKSSLLPAKFGEPEMQVAVDSWPYTFPVSQDFPRSAQRGSVSGRLLVKDRYVSPEYMPADSAHVGLALPGEAGSWQKECKGYQFWTRADPSGFFTIKNIRTGNYNLYASVPGFIGDYKNDMIISITEGCEIDLGELVFEPPRAGHTLWEIGIPDRSAGEFYVPDPNPMYINKLFINHPDKFRQYGLWERYADLYPDSDLVYTVGVSNYQKDWFFAQVTRKIGENEYQATTWQIKFKLDTINQSGPYTLRVAIASATYSELQVRTGVNIENPIWVRFNDPKADPPHFSSGEIGKDNSIARHGLHGLYLLLNIDVPKAVLVEGDNTIFLTQALSLGPFRGILYDYIRLEAPANPSYASQRSKAWIPMTTDDKGLTVHPGLLSDMWVLWCDMMVNEVHWLKVAVAKGVVLFWQDNCLADDDATSSWQDSRVVCNLGGFSDGVGDDS